MHPHPTRRQFLTAVAAAPAITLVQAPARGDDEKGEVLPLSATVILVRHTEKAANDRVDPDLSEAGVERAKALTQLLSAAGITELIHSEYKRTRDTLAPLAAALGLESVEIAAERSAELHARLSRAKPDEVIVVAGHSNTVPAAAYAFGVELPDLDESVIGPSIAHGFLPHEAYDRVHVLTPGGKAARLLELRYGEPS